MGIQLDNLPVGANTLHSLGRHADSYEREDVRVQLARKVREIMYDMLNRAFTACMD